MALAPVAAEARTGNPSVNGVLSGGEDVRLQDASGSPIRLKPKAGPVGYFVIVFLVTAADSAVAVLLWSSIGCDKDCIQTLRDNEDLSYVAGGLCAATLALLYILDYFLPPHLPQRRCRLSERNNCWGILLVSFAIVNFLLACLFCANTYPSAPLLITLFLLPVVLALVRYALRPEEPVGLQEWSSPTSEEHMDQVLRMLVDLETDQQQFYGMASAAMAFVGVITSFVWIFWAFTTADGEKRIEALDQGDADTREVLIILWTAPLVTSGTHLLFAVVSFFRVVLSSSYARTDESRNRLVVEAATAPEAEAKRQSLLQVARFTQGVPASMRMSFQTQEKYLKQHEVYLERLTGAFKMLTCCFIILISILYIVTQLVASESHLAKMAQGFIGGFFVTVVAFVYFSFRRLFKALEAWIVEMPLFKTMTAFTESDWVRAAVICVVLPIIPLLLLLTVINQWVRKVRGIYHKVPLEEHAVAPAVSRPQWVAGESKTWNREGVQPADFEAVASSIADDNEDVREKVFEFLLQAVETLQDETSAASAFQPFKVSGCKRLQVDVTLRKASNGYQLCSVTLPSYFSGAEEEGTACRITISDFLTKDDPILVADDVEDPSKKESRWVTDRVHKYLQYMQTWDRVSITEKIYIVGFLFAAYTLCPRLLNVFLSWMSYAMSDFELVMICIVTFFVGLMLFLLPPVPGAPVYLFGGVVITQKYMKTHAGPASFYIGSGICIILCFFLKLVACAMQQKLIGENLGNNQIVRQNVCVHKPFIRALESILSAPGLSFGKCVVLMGGPDWPTSVLCGVLRLSLCQCLLGTCPIIIYVIPLTLTGCFYVMQNEGEVYVKLGRMMFLLTFVITVVLWACIAWVVQTEMDRNHAALTRPMEKYVDLDWLDERAARVSAAGKVTWTQVPHRLRFILIMGAVGVDLAAWGFYQFASLFFGKFQVTDDFRTLQTNPTADNATITVVGYVGLAVLCVSYLGNVIFGNWRWSFTKAKVDEVSQELDKEKDEWIARRIAEARTYGSSSAGETPAEGRASVEGQPSEPKILSPLPSVLGLGGLPAEDTDASTVEADENGNASKASNPSQKGKKLKRKTSKKAAPPENHISEEVGTSHEVDKVEVESGQPRLNPLDLE